MGQIAEDVEVGLQCSWCGICFKHEHGFPVLCKGCVEHMNKDAMKKCGLQKATIREVE